MINKSIFIVLALPLVLTACSHIQTSNIPQDDEIDNNATPSTKLAPTDAASMSASVTAEDSGFTPKEITVKKGGTVTWTNNSSAKVWVASAMHPDHLIYPEFDELTGMNIGSTWSYTFDKVGTWGYHDHLKAKNFGKVIVVE